LSSFRLGRRPDELQRLASKSKRVAVILNADDYKQQEDREASLAREIDDLATLGLDADEVDLRRYFGRADRLSSRLAGYGVLWVRGGNPFILRRAMAYSGADLIVRDLLERDAVVYAGYSAGAAMATPSLEGIELVDDPHDVPPGYDPEVVVDCLGVIPCHLAPHYRSDHPESERIDDVVRYFIDNHLPFIALRDGEAMVKDGERDYVVG
jgi:dipeptidase E